jgi:hypothetical protein
MSFDDFAKSDKKKNNKETYKKDLTKSLTQWVVGTKHK